MSSVEISKTPDYDCGGMNEVDFKAWSDAVRERPEGGPIMEPNEFALLRK
jgi:hypothetical protein